MDGYLKEPQLNQDMFYQSKVLFVVLIAILCGCAESEDNSNKELELIKEREKFEQIILRSNNKENRNIYNNAIDTLKNWCDNNLGAVIELTTMGYQLDSVICLNVEKNKFIGALLIPCTRNDCMQDDIRYFYGVKINLKWYYFFGPTIVLPQEKPHTPRTFPQLHEIAMKEVFSGYLKKNVKGEWEINEKFFDRIEFQYTKWGYWDKNNKQIDNSKLSDDSLKKLYLNRIVYDKYR